MGHVRIEPVPDALRREFPDASPFQWLLRVEHGKGNRARWVPCDEIALSLQAYRIAFGLPPVPIPAEDLPLLLSVRRARWGELKGVRSRTAIWKLVTGLCHETLAFARTEGGRIDAERLERASTHWVRHSHAKGLAQAVRHGLDASGVLENMGHSDLRTFRQYVDDEPLKRALATGHCRRPTNRPLMGGFFSSENSADVVPLRGDIRPRTIYGGATDSGRHTSRHRKCA